MLKQKFRSLKFEGLSEDDFTTFLHSIPKKRFNNYAVYISAKKDQEDTVEKFKDKTLGLFKSVTFFPVNYKLADGELELYFFMLKSEEPLAESRNSVYAFLYMLSIQSDELNEEISILREELKESIYTDFLTMLPNLYKLRADLESRSDECSYVVVNIDNFKKINNFYGFIVGDFVLEMVVKTLNSAKEEGSLYRVAGDEFAILTDKRKSYYELKDYLDSLSKKLTNIHFTYYNTSIYVDCTVASSASISVSDIFSKVNMALRFAKNNRKRYWVYEDHMQLGDRYENNLKISKKIQSAIENSGVIPYFQPIVSNETGKIEKFESLARLIDENGNILLPEEFMPLAKNIKFYEQITKTIIDKSFEIFKDRKENFSINLSVDDIVNRETYQYIINSIKKSNLGEYLTFEFVEPEYKNNFEELERFVNEVKHFGVRIAIDDFGGSFSDFSFITKIDIDYIKIDDIFIQEIAHNKKMEAIVAAIISLAKSLGIKTVAEFVHSDETLLKVKELGIDYSQGFYLDQPKPDLIKSLSSVQE